MHRSRALVVAASAALFLITALGAPASALTKGAIAVVNGIPGQRVDVCVNGNEIRSRLAYGGHVSKTVAPGAKVLKIFRTDPRTCKGTLLAQKAFSLAEPPLASSDLTFVATKHSPKKVVVFDNAGLGTIPFDGSPFEYGFIAWRQASDLGDVNFLYRLGTGGPVGPAANPIWQKGDQYVQGLEAGYAIILRATFPDKAATLAKAPLVTSRVERRHEWYLLGTDRHNAKLITFARGVSEPAP